MKKTHAVVLMEGQGGQTSCKGKRSRGAELAAVRNGAEKPREQRRGEIRRLTWVGDTEIGGEGERGHRTRCPGREQHLPVWGCQGHLCFLQQCLDAARLVGGFVTSCGKMVIWKKKKKKSLIFNEISPLN